MARRCGTKKTAKKKAKYACKICGLVVSVDNLCGCVDTCDIVCCGEEMKLTK
ncbi:MAG: hypothetical protein NC923_01180 [Candidatus Omnitrophica bacterium]|nr:hypothetical protein [Candidatus Omnitrophota bacterium]